MTKKNFFTPSMLTKFINCKQIISNEYFEKSLNLIKKKLTITDELRIQKGILHEDLYFKELKKKYSKVKNIKSLKNLSKKEKNKETIKAIQEGYEIIYGGFLISGSWSGELDFLEINRNVKSKLGNYSYEIIDTKNSSKVKGDHIYQLGVYAYLLKNIQGTLPEKFYILLKDSSKQPIKLNEIYDTFLFHKKSYEDFLNVGIKKTTPEKCSFCKFCQWADQCNKEWTENRDVNQVLENNRKNCQAFKKSGITTYDDIARLDPKKNIEGIREEVKIKRINQAKLQIEAEKKGIPIFKPIKENLLLNKGFNLLSMPDEHDLFFDIEGVQDYVFPNRLEYLFGVYFEEQGKKIYKSFWAHNKDEEKKTIIDFFKFTNNHFKKYPNSKIYHYAPYEINALERLTSIHKVNSVDYDHYLNLGKFVDLYKIVKQAVHVSQKSYSIKDIEKYYDFQRSGDILKGDVSEEFYIKWMQSKDQKLLNTIEEYNKQDCISTFKLRKWLLRIKPSETRWHLPEKKKIELRPFEEAFLEYQEKLKNSKSKEIKIIKLLTDIIGFYAREQRPQWRLHFDRKDLSNEELIDDRECIANMKQVSVFQDKRSLCYKYIFSDQEYKLKKGRSVIIANNTDPNRSDFAGKIQELDQIKQSLILRKGLTREDKQLPRILSISEKVMNHDRFDNLNKNIYRFCENIIKEKDGFEAIKAFINRDLPKIKGVKAGNKIIEGENFDTEIPKVISNLQKSFLYIQGGPGSGKTYQASNAIIELIKKNKKIAITANSHKVIHNLLNNVEQLALNKKVSFKGLKMGNIDNEDSFYDGKFIKTEKNEKKYIDAFKENNIHLFAGTKYHLSQWYYQGKLDFLFVEEASQISVADLVALGGITKNIILVGDSAQLGQPLQGAHPGESGNSVLDYLLEGKDTISEEKGIFLNKTYRLHPKINSFTSKNFYEGRLLTNKENINRRIEYKKNSIIKSEGIHTILMKHQNRSQTSIEEFEVIKSLMEGLIGSKFIDFDKSERSLVVEDILIVSPFNAQVNFLKARLQKGALVGTVDLFQGMQSPITIISMTSSSVEDLPRNKKFFYNRNRLNVAISRAQCCSIVLLNKELLSSPPLDYEEFKLMNNFQKLLNFKIN